MSRIGWFGLPIFALFWTAPLYADVAEIHGSPIIFGDWRQDHPGALHKIAVGDLPSPYATGSSGNSPGEARPLDNAQPQVPAGFQVKLFAQGFQQPRLMRTAPNGDVFVAETGADKLRILRFADNADKPRLSSVFASGLNEPFGIAFYPAGPNPAWVYVANTDSVVRFPYHDGDLQAQGKPETVIKHLPSGGGHTTRDIVFSPDGRNMYVSVGSASNVAQGMSTQDTSFIESWQAAHGTGATWDDETDRADVLVANPDGTGLKSFANGIRNCVGLASQQAMGKLWCSTNERDGLGDDLAPDYVTSVTEGGFYGWPWYYIGRHEDPRHARERPDLKDHVITPDVLIQPHSAPLQMAFYEGAEFPASYRGDAFVALHGSWNRSKRTGYKVVRVLFQNGKPTGAYEDFLTGFVVSDRSVWGRPVGVTVTHDGALLVSEDTGGTIWRIDWKGSPAK